MITIIVMIAIMTMIIIVIIYILDFCAKAAQPRRTSQYTNERETLIRNEYIRESWRSREKNNNIANNDIADKNNVMYTNECDAYTE